jgi:hypothetical protein
MSALLFLGHSEPDCILAYFYHDTRKLDRGWRGESNFSLLNEVKYQIKSLIATATVWMPFPSRSRPSREGAMKAGPSWRTSRHNRAVWLSANFGVRDPYSRLKRSRLFGLLAGMSSGCCQLSLVHISMCFARAAALPCTFWWEALFA